MVRYLIILGFLQPETRRSTLGVGCLKSQNNLTGLMYSAPGLAAFATLPQAVQTLGPHGNKMGYEEILILLALPNG